MSNQPYPDSGQPIEQPVRNRRSARHERAGQPQPAAEPRRASYPPEPSDAPPSPYSRPAKPVVYADDPVYSEQQQPAYNRDAYGRSLYDDEEEGDYAPRRWPWAILAVVLALALAFAAIQLLIPASATGIMGSARKLTDTAVDGVKGLLGMREPVLPQLIKFETPSQETAVGVKAVFTFTADRAIQGVRMSDEVGNVVTGTLTNMNEPENTLWTISTVFDRPAQRTLRAEMMVDGRWYASDKVISMAVVEPTMVPTTIPATDAPLPATASMAPDATQGAESVPTASWTAPPTQQAAFVIVSPQPLPQTTAEVPTAEATAEAVAILPEPTAAPETATAEPAATVVPAPTATPMPALTVTASEDTSPDKLAYQDTVYVDGKSTKELARTQPLNMPAPGDYTGYEGGVFTFRKDSFRGNAAFGTADVQQGALTELWKAEVGSLRANTGAVYGIGWTGQPAIVKWMMEIRAMMNIKPEKRDVTALKEVIIAAQDGKVYFLDLMDGQPTRDPIDIGFPLKGSVSVDPNGRPLMAVGQGISMLSNKTGDIGLHVYNLIDQSEAYFLNGRRSDKQSQFSTNGAFDGTALFDRVSDNLIVAGENGLVYTLKLNSTFDYKDKMSITIDPEVTFVKSKGKQDNNTVTMEGSVAMYGKCIFVADKQGFVRCIDSDSMTTVWAFDAGDNTDATLALGFDPDGSLGLYTGNTAHARLGSRKDVTLRRLNALTGEQVWGYEIKSKYNKEERGGAKASPIVGEREISDLVIFTVNMTENDGSTMVALNKQTGAVVWQHALAAQTVSSPVAVYNEAGQSWIIQGDESGKLTMLHGKTGQVVTELALEGAIDGSPAVYNDYLVVGTTARSGSYIYGVRIQ